MSQTRTKILDIAERMTQVRGFNGFSYLDIAAEIGVKNSSIHYHFKAKADLAMALVTRTSATHVAAFQTLDDTLESPNERLDALIQFFQGYVEQNRFCLCGMMAAELHSVNADVQSALAEYFSHMQTWLSRQFLQMGHPSPASQALQFASALEGSLLLARLHNDPTIVRRVLQPLSNR